MKCKACNATTAKADEYKLPDGSDNLLCGKCVDIARSCNNIHTSPIVDEYLVKAIYYGGQDA